MSGMFLFFVINVVREKDYWTAPIIAQFLSTYVVSSAKIQNEVLYVLLMLPILKNISAHCGILEHWNSQKNLSAPIIEHNAGAENR